MSAFIVIAQKRIEYLIASLENELKRMNRKTMIRMLEVRIRKLEKADA